MQNDKKIGKAVTLVSGGLDSCVTAAVAARDHHLALLHVDYGQKTESRERKSFNNIAQFYGAGEKRIVNARFIGDIGGSSLTEPDKNIPALLEALKDGKIPSTYVPFRNAVFLSIAVAWAEVLEATSVYIGAVQSDRPGYPDCREEFFAAFNRVVRLGIRPESHIQIVAPLLHSSKKDIVLKGVELGAPLHQTWSCYGEQEIACGCCESCVLRRQGFSEAGIQDPVPYADPEIGR